MSATIDAINTAMDEAVTAQAAGDYATALIKAESAWIRICGLPDSEFENERLEWSRDGLKSVLDHLQKKANQQAIAASTSGGIFQSTDILYKRDCRQ